MATERDRLLNGAANIVIIGGSLAGLMCGIALKNNGCNVVILEQDNDERESHMAGVCLGRDAEDFLARHDRVDTVFAHALDRVQVLGQDGNPMMFVNGRRVITNWDTMYLRLRVDFDGYSSSHYPDPPPARKGDGKAIYRSRTLVTDIRRQQPRTSGMTIETRSLATGATSTIHADLVIGADGPNSFVRSKYLPHCQRNYVGNIAWRGTVLESEVSAETRAIFNKNATVSMLHRQHTIMYTIPGHNGTLSPGARYLNFLWYTNETPSSLTQIMTDKTTAQVHHNIVPRNHVRPSIWSHQLHLARILPLAPPFLEIFQKIQNPFIQRVTSFCSPRAVFDHGRVILVGDALSLYRPHTAFSCTQAAFHALRVEEYVTGRITIDTMEEKMLRFSRLHWAQSEWWGMFYQNHIAVALLAAARYWAYCAVDAVKAWWAGEEPLLRTSLPRGKTG